VLFATVVVLLVPAFYVWMCVDQRMDAARDMVRLLGGGALMAAAFYVIHEVVSAF
jgi:hypothetical protein